MVNNRKFIVSGGLFSGFDSIVNLDEINSNCDIINCVKENLKTFYKTNETYTDGRLYTSICL